MRGVSRGQKGNTKKMMVRGTQPRRVVDCA